jgi:beta-glucanase (GH16 family)
MALAIYLLAGFLIPLAAMEISDPKFEEQPPAYPASNLAEDSYDAGEGWRLVWADEFDGETLNEAFWNRQVLPAGQFNKEWQAYTGGAGNAYLEDGCLVIKATHKGGGHGHDQYTSARLNTAGKQAWTYGKIVARAQLPYGMGMWPAFWMLGANCNEVGGDTPWPFCGEIDIFELYGSKSDAIAEANIHFANAEGEHEQLEPPKFELSGETFADAFHVFEIEWDESSITWRVDGESYGSVDITTADKQEFHHPHFILLNVAVGGTWAGRPDETTPFPQFMYVDWVRVYQK